MSKIVSASLSAIVRRDEVEARVAQRDDDDGRKNRRGNDDGDRIAEHREGGDDRAEHRGGEKGGADLTGFRKEIEYATRDLDHSSGDPEPLADSDRGEDLDPH